MLFGRLLFEAGGGKMKHHSLAKLLVLCTTISQNAKQRTNVLVRLGGHETDYGSSLRFSTSGHFVCQR